MSRIGKLPIKVPTNVDIICNELEITVKGKFGILNHTIPDSIVLEQTENLLFVKAKQDDRVSRALHGLQRTLINNMVIGVSQQFKLTLILKGVGYRALVQDKSIILNLGYSHPIVLEIPKGIFVEIIQNTTVNLKACDKQNLGLFASQIRSWRSPEPYKGKGILYENEIVQRKAGKSGKK